MNYFKKKHYFLSEKKLGINEKKIVRIIKEALAEDIGNGDITSQFYIPAEKKVKALIFVRDNCVICGMTLARRVFKTLDKKIKFKALVKDGQRLNKGRVIARLFGNTRNILSGERVALNFLSLLSGIATKTRSYVKEIKPYRVRITDTRKTIPGIRELQKYAVRIGGGYNHRMGLDEMILIKDNHLKANADCQRISNLPRGVKIEIEVGNLREFKHALRFQPDVIMLDNMSIQDIKQAVKMKNRITYASHHPHPQLEISGGIDLRNLRKAASTGVDIISVGGLTHSVKAIDISLEVL